MNTLIHFGRKAISTPPGSSRFGGNRLLRFALAVSLGLSLLTGGTEALAATPPSALHQGQKVTAGVVPAGLDAASWEALQVQFNQEAKLTADDGATGDLFASKLAVDGDTVVIGAPYKIFSGGFFQGKVYVYVRNGSSWTQQETFFINSLNNDLFGASVALSGDTIVVGSPRERDASAQFHTGAAYVYVRAGGTYGTWSFEARLTAPDAQDMDYFGGSVTVDDDTAVIGASDDDTQQGSAYVFVRSGGSWSQQAKLTATDSAAFARFGNAVSLSANTLLIGAEDADTGNVDDNAGAAYVFVRAGGLWTEQAKLSDPPLDGNRFQHFGTAVALDGDTAVIGASGRTVGSNSYQGAAYVYVRNGNSWNQQALLTSADGGSSDFFGSSVAISGDTAAVGAYAVDYNFKIDPGAAYVFGRTAGFWTQQARLTAADGNSADFFGDSIALSGDTVVVGADNADLDTISEGAAYVFRMEAAPTSVLSIGDASIFEGNTGKTKLRFTITLTPASTVPVSVRARTVNGTAINGSDFLGGSRTFTFAPGQTSLSGSVQIITDSQVEPDESFSVNLSEATGGAVLGRSQATGSILNDD